VRERLCVLLAGEFPQHPPTTIGGIQAVTWQLASGLASIGDLEVHTLACERFWQEPPARRWRSEWVTPGGANGTAHYLTVPRQLPHVLASWTSDAAYVRHTLHSVGAQLVHAHGQVGYTVGAISSGLPHVVTPHGMLVREKRAPADAGRFSGDRLREALWLRTEDWCLANARHMIVISPYVRALIAPRSRAALHDIPNPVDPDFLALGKRRGAGEDRGAAKRAPIERIPTERIPPERTPIERTPTERVAADRAPAPTLLTVGWVNARKRHELILRALPHVRKRLPGVRLRIVGNVEAGERAVLEGLRRLAVELGVAQAVDFLSGLSHEQLLAEYRDASLYVHAAQEESSPVAVAQAMAAGLALCAVDIPGLHHLLIEGRTGLYARTAEPQALAQALVRLIENPALCSALGAEGHRHAQAHFHPTAVAAATADLYREVLAQARR
jgi:glycosyltransferase involved in cell wall biosynthesis